MQDKGIELLISQDTNNMNYLTGYDAWSFYYTQCVIVHVNAEEPLCFVRAQDAGGAYIKTYLKKENVIIYEEKYIHTWPMHPYDPLIELIKKDMTWSISGNDSLKIKDNYIDNFLDKIFQLNKKHLVTSKKDNWNTYGVNAEEGFHLALINNTGETMSYFVFGRTKNDYNSCFVKIEKEIDVYLLDDNVIHQLQTNINYWGEPISKQNIEEVIN